MKILGGTSVPPFFHAMVFPMPANPFQPAEAARPLMAELIAALSFGDRLGVDRIVDRLLRLRAPLGQQWRAIAQASRRNGILSSARAAMVAYVTASNGSASARFERAAFLAEIGDVVEAEDVLNALPADFPDPATRAHFLGTLALGRGKLDVARARFADAIAARPESGASWLALTDALRGTPPDTWAPSVIEAARSMSPRTEPERAALLYAAGAAHAALEDQDSAFAAFEAGAGIMRRLRPYDARADRAAAEQASAFVPASVRATIQTDRAIFVFGPPRSGTTLVEQILASHSAVSDGGEIGLFDLVADRIGGLSRAHLDRAIAAVGGDALANDYLGLVSERFGPSGRIVDKTLTSTRLAGLIASVLPNAPLVWVRRAPLDVAWSCYHTFFARGLDWSWDQRDLAAHLRLEDRLLEAWSETLGERLMVLDYAALVSDPKRQIAGLNAHCGLTIEPGQLEPHMTQRAVTTASVTQVRGPITTRAIDAALPYRQHLAPFIEAYCATGGIID